MNVFHVDHVVAVDVAHVIRGEIRQVFREALEIVPVYDSVTINVVALHRPEIR